LYEALLSTLNHPHRRPRIIGVNWADGAISTSAYCLICQSSRVHKKKNGRVKTVQTLEVIIAVVVVLYANGDSSKMGKKHFSTACNSRSTQDILISFEMLVLKHLIFPFLRPYMVKF